MKQRHTLVFVSILLGSIFLIAIGRLVVAQPVDVTPLPPVTEADGRAGACYSFYYDPPEGPHRPFIQMAYDAGSRWDRFDFIWPNLEPGNDSWSPEVLDAYDTLVEDLDEAGVHMVGILLWTPDWAATAGATAPSTPFFDRRPQGWYASGPEGGFSLQAAAASSSPPQGLYEEWDDWTAADGDGINYWGRFVHTVVSRYEGRVKHWEMWNEPEWTYFWTGTSVDYAQLLKVGYQATKAACPDCTVLFGGLHYWANQDYYRWVLSILSQDRLASQNNTFFDVMSVHLYSRSASIYDEVNNIRSGMAVYGVGDHPIWLTETGVPVWGDPDVSAKPKYDYAATVDEAAAYVIQSYANAWASDVQRYFFFRTNDGDMGEYFGLIRNDHSLRPAYVAYQVATTYLISPTFTTRVFSDPGLRVTLWGTPRGKVSALWAESPVTSVYTLPAALDSAVVVDRLGVTETIAPSGGVYTFALPKATANLVSNPDDYFIGGEPVLVIESETPNEPPTSTVRPLPGVSYSATITVTWTGADNQAGVWLYDVQVRDGEDGSWTYWQHSTEDTSGRFTGEHDHTYYFRSRATDRVGNREDWPEGSQAHTTFELVSVLHLRVGDFFADEDRDDVWDKPITATDEITLTDVVLSFVDAAGQDVITPTTKGAFTTTIWAGQVYQLWATSADHVRRLPFTWPQGGEVYTETYSALGLWPVERLYLPLAMRN